MRDFIINFLTSVMNCNISGFASEDFNASTEWNPTYGSIKITGRKTKDKATFDIERTKSNGHICSRVPVMDMPLTSDNIEYIANLACENL